MPDVMDPRRRAAAPSDATAMRPRGRRREALDDLLRGSMLGLGMTGTNLARGVGALPGLAGARDWADETERQMTETYDPQGTWGMIGTGGGRIAGELATMLAGGSAVTKGLGMVAPGAGATLKEMQAGPGLVKRMLGYGMSTAPVATFSGAGNTPEAPGRGAAMNLAYNTPLVGDALSAVDAVRGVGGAAKAAASGDGTEATKRLLWSAVAGAGALPMLGFMHFEGKPQFFSRLRNAVEGTDFGARKAKDPEAWLAHLNKQAQRGEVGREEIEQVLGQPLREANEPLTRDQVLALGDNNPTTLSETVYGAGGEEPAKFKSYVNSAITASDPEKYREIVLHLNQPGQVAPFRVPVHWPQDNPLLHLRVGEFDAPGGGRRLHVYETQSDWHQKGRRSGYDQYRDVDKSAVQAAVEQEKMLRPALQQMDEQIAAAQDAHREALNRWDVLRQANPSVGEAWEKLVALSDLARRSEVQQREYDALLGFLRGFEDVRAAEAAEESLEALYRQRASIDHSLGEASGLVRAATKGIVPGAPFRETNDWTGLAARRLLDELAQGDYRALTYTPGVEQAKLWANPGLIPYYDQTFPKVMGAQARRIGAPITMETIHGQPGFWTTPEMLERIRRGLPLAAVGGLTTGALLRQSLQPPEVK